ALRERRQWPFQCGRFPLPEQRSYQQVVRQTRRPLEMTRTTAVSGSTPNMILSDDVEGHSSPTVRPCRRPARALSALWHTLCFLLPREQLLDHQRQGRGGHGRAHGGGPDGGAA